ncbi:MAG: alanine racemase [Myxococcota bacterium]
MTRAAARYAQLAKAMSGERLPAAVVDLDAVDANLDRLIAPARDAGKTIRVATKSIRSVDLLRYLFERAPKVLSGLMCYSAAEIRYLFDAGFDDFLLAYPTVQPADLETLATLGARTRLRVVVDHPTPVQLLAQAARRQGTEAALVIDVDASWRPFGGRLHVGVRRSPIHTPTAALELADLIRDTAGVRLEGLLTYEAQVAGLGDRSPFSALLNPAKGWLRRRSMRAVAKLRTQLAEAFASAGHALPLFNGAGTGNLDWAAQEAPLTELTAGSGFLASHFFDYYSNLELEAASFFALQITRRPTPRIVTCHGGGYVASGEAGPDRLPRPWLPEGLQLLSLEGAGEVQTPLAVPAGLKLELGAPVFFRHAKTGELSEHFQSYVLIRGAERVGQARTYRGDGQVF